MQDTDGNLLKKIKNEAISHLQAMKQRNNKKWCLGHI